jgi:hypothetical protein
MSVGGRQRSARGLLRGGRQAGLQRQEVSRPAQRIFVAWASTPDEGEHVLLGLDHGFPQAPCLLRELYASCCLHDQ